MSEFTCELPMPPSLNMMNKNVPGIGRVNTREYRAWKHVAGLLLQSQFSKAGKPKIEKPYGLKINIHKNHNCDISNRIKPIEDLLVKVGVTPDDKFANKVSAERFEVGDPKLVTVHVWSMNK